ncbi:PPE FAMILY domain protein [Mycobacterium kansasii 732]|nr:PPE FAMILY domain protein [Mycobacterium kansasii 732]
MTAVGLPEVGVPLYELGVFVNTLKLPKILKDDFTALDALFAWYSTMGSVTGVSGMANGIINTEKSLGLISGVAQPVADTAPKVARPCWPRSMPSPNHYPEQPCAPEASWAVKSRPPRAAQAPSDNCRCPPPGPHPRPPSPPKHSRPPPP